MQNPWLPNCTADSPALVRLFCFPYAGASASIFRGWKAGLPAKVQVCPIQLPGRGTRLKEAAFTELRPLVNALTAALGEFLDRPVAFFGHSLGSLLCFEMARAFRREQRRKPVHLFVSGHRAPHLPARESYIHRLSDAEFLQELQRLNGTPVEILENQDIMEILFGTLRADLAVAETYTYDPEPPLECPISAFGGLQDPKASLEQLLPWEDQTTRTFSLQMFRGDHFFLHTAEAGLLQKVSTQLKTVVKSII